MKKFYIAILLLVIGFAGLDAQTAQERTNSSASEPYELPKLNIIGNYQAEIKASEKKNPERLVPLKKGELDSLNSLEKQQTMLLPPGETPEHIISSDYAQGYVRADGGSFLTPRVEGGYGLRYEGYELYGNAGLELSDGHVDNAGYSDVFLNVSSDYIAPMKFWVFGGSRTRTYLNFRNRGYKLYPMLKPDDRNLMNFKFGVDVDGDYEGYQFKTGAQFKSLQLSGDYADGFDNAFRGYVGVETFYKKYFVGGNLDIDMHATNGSSAKMIQMDGHGAFSNDKLTFKLNAGLQFANASIDNSRTGFLLAANLEYRLNKNVTITGRLESGLDKNFYYDMAEHNPYINPNIITDMPYNIGLIKGFLTYHPSQRFAISAGFEFRKVERLPAFVPFAMADSTLNQSMFDVEYMDATLLGINVESFWAPTDADRMTLKMKALTSNSDEYEKNIPYYAPIEMGINYRRVWADIIGTEIGLVYVGERYADQKNDIKIDSFNKLMLGADYKINDDFSVFIKFDNLLNSNVYVWNTYKERDLFVSAGIMWQF